MKLSSCHIIATISIFFLSSTLYGQGLEFKGNDYPIDERTSYNVFNDTPIQFFFKIILQEEIIITSISPIFK